MSSSQFNKGPSYGLSAEVKNRLAQKYDPQKEAELRTWIESVTGQQIGPDFQKGLKDGVILCELMNKLQPNAVRKINRSAQNWHQLENLSNFIKAMASYGMNPVDLFEANDLFESGNLTQVQVSLLALAGMVRARGRGTGWGHRGCGPWGVIRDPPLLPRHPSRAGQDQGDAERRGHRRQVLGEAAAELRRGQDEGRAVRDRAAGGLPPRDGEPPAPTAVVGVWGVPCGVPAAHPMGMGQSPRRAVPGSHRAPLRQMGTNKCASQSGMTAYGTRRHLYDPKNQILPPMDHSTISLQMGTNKCASQVGMTAPGTRRHIYDAKMGLEKCDNSSMSLQMGSNQGANQSGQVFGLGRQIYDPKYCPQGGQPEGGDTACEPGADPPGYHYYHQEESC
ncbi:calponin-2 isoform X1 [Cygnus olor]|uniref:calponin-2 isoform X1 n=1 Tax=Cygnus olor TaxID=8869 RepID=UPI001ADDFE2D|nr:calponin-2 isoform X1 [Cygnus olor]